MARIGLVWAQAHDGVIGARGGLPWHLPEDLAHFKAVTDGWPVVMGRRTWESLPERFRPLPGRRNIVVTRQSSWQAEGAERAGSVDDALALASAGLADDAWIWIIGGADVYRQVIGRADRLEVTEVDLAVEGDAHAPAIGAHWHLEPSAAVPSSPEPSAAPDLWLTSRTGTRYRFRTYTRTRTRTR